MEKLSEFCRKINILQIPYTKLSAAIFKLTMERLTELAVLCISISPTQDGLEITRIIGQSKKLVSLDLRSFGAKTVTEGLLKPIADGCPNLSTLKCEAFNCHNSDICYLMQRKKHQLVSYSHYGHVSADLINAINECKNLKRLALIGVNFDGPFHKIPPITNLKNLSVLELPGCRFPMLKIIPLTLFLDRLSHLSYIGIPHAHANIEDLINKIIFKCPLLTHLNLEGNDELRCRALRNISCCKMLNYLDVSSCKQIGKKAIKYIAEGCPQLEHLDVSGIPLSDGMFRKILRCRNLKALLMWDCNLSGINLHLIPTNISGLLYLYIGPPSQLRDDVLSQVNHRMADLVIPQPSVAHNRNNYSKHKTEYIDLYF
jgi:hypothetical protein